MQPPDFTDTTDRLAYFLSECHNDSAPIGWQRYRNLAILLIHKLDIKDQIDDERFLDYKWQNGAPIKAP